MGEVEMPEFQEVLVCGPCSVRRFGPNTMGTEAGAENTGPRLIKTARELLQLAKRVINRSYPISHCNPSASCTGRQTM